MAIVTTPECTAATECDQLVAGVTAVEVHSWVSRPQDDGVTAWVDEARRWVGEVVAERPRGPAT